MPGNHRPTYRRRVESLDVTSKTKFIGRTAPCPRQRRFNVGGRAVKRPRSSHVFRLIHAVQRNQDAKRRQFLGTRSKRTRGGASEKFGCINRRQAAVPLSSLRLHFRTRVHARAGGREWAAGTRGTYHGKGCDNSLVGAVDDGARRKARSAAAFERPVTPV